MSFFSSAPVPEPPATDEERQALIEQQRANQQRRLMHYTTELANLVGLPPYAPQYLNTGFHPLLTAQQVQEFTAASSSAARLSGFSSAPSAMSPSPAPPVTPQSSTSTTHQPSGFVFNPSVPAPAPTSQASMQIHPSSSNASAAGRPLFPEWTANVQGRRRRETTFPEFAHAPTGHYQFPAAPLPDPAAAGIPPGGGGALAGNAAASSLNHTALMSLQSGLTPLAGRLPTFVPPWAFNSAAAAPATAPTSFTDNPRPMSSGNSAALPATSASDRAARSEEDFLHMQSELAFNPFLYQAWATWDHRRRPLDPSAYFHQQHAPNASTAPVVSNLLPGQQQLVQLGKVAMEEYNATRIVPKTPYNDLLPNGQPKGPNYFVPPEKRQKTQEEIRVRKKTNIAQALVQEEIKKKVPKFTSSGEERDAPRTCTNCKKLTHDRRNCPLPRFEGGREIFAGRSCTLCGSTEHDKRTCDKKEKKTSLPSAPPSRGRAAAPRGRGPDVDVLVFPTNLPLPPPTAPSHHRLTATSISSTSALVPFRATNQLSALDAAPSFNTSQFTFFFYPLRDKRIPIIPLYSIPPAPRHPPPVMTSSVAPPKSATPLFDASLLLYTLFRFLAGVFFDIPYSLNCASLSSDIPSPGHLCKVHHGLIASPEMDAYFSADRVLSSRSLEIRAIVGICGYISVLLFLHVALAGARRGRLLLLLLAAFASQLVTILALWLLTVERGSIQTLLLYNVVDLVALPIILFRLIVAAPEESSFGNVNVKGVGGSWKAPLGRVEKDL